MRRQLLFLMLCPLLLFGQGTQIQQSTVANLPNPPSHVNTVFYVTDGTSTSDCTVGGGTTPVFCTWNGTTWVSGGGILVVSSLPALPCTNAQQVYLNTNTSFGQGLYNCINGNWYLAVSGTTNSFYATGWGVKADEFDIHDATWTNTLNTVTCPNSDCNFVAAQDNGKLCWGVDTSSGTATLPLGTLTVTGANSATCSTATGSRVANGNFAWCTDDTAAWLALRAAYYASQRNAFIIGPGGHTCVTKAPLLDTRANVSEAARWQPSFQTPDAMTIFVATPTFDFTTCGTVAGGNGGCFWDSSPTGGGDQADLPQYNKVQNFGVTGLGLSTCGAGSANKKLVAFRRVEGSNIWLWNWCLDSTTTGANVIAPNSFFNINMNQFGSIAMQATGGASNSVTYIASSYIGQQSFSLLSIGSGANVVSKASYYLGCAAACVTIQSGGVLSSDGDQLFGNAGTQYFDVTGTLFIEGNTLVTDSTNGGSAILTRSGGKVFVRRSNIQETGTGGIAFNINTVTGGSIINEGDNTIVGTDQTALVAANVVPSAGWGASATVGSLSGTPLSNPTRFQFTVTSAGAGQAANPTLAITYPGTGGTITQPYWTCKQTGGTGVNTSITGEGTATTTSMTLTFNGTPVAASTYQITCQGTLL